MSVVCTDYASAEALVNRDEVATIVPDEDQMDCSPKVENLQGKATMMAKLTDVHLDYERQGRIPLSMDELSPRRLCPEQRVDLVTDLYAIVMLPDGGK